MTAHTRNCYIRTSLSSSQHCLGSNGSPTTSPREIHDLTWVRGRNQGDQHDEGNRTKHLASGFDLQFDQQHKNEGLESETVANRNENIDCVSRPSIPKPL